jgi:hypothetical protein
MSWSFVSTIGKEITSLEGASNKLREDFAREVKDATQPGGYLEQWSAPAELDRFKGIVEGHIKAALDLIEGGNVGDVSDPNTQFQVTSTGHVNPTPVASSYADGTPVPVTAPVTAQSNANVQVVAETVVPVTPVASESDSAGSDSSADAPTSGPPEDVVASSESGGAASDVVADTASSAPEDSTQAEAAAGDAISEAQAVADSEPAGLSTGELDSTQAEEAAGDAIVDPSVTDTVGGAN